MGDEIFTKTYRPGAFVPSTSYTGSEDPLILSGENMWVRYGRFGSVYAEGYRGNFDLSEPIAVQLLSGAAPELTWNSSSLEIIGGAGALFIEELRPGMAVMANGGGIAKTELFIVMQVIDDTHFIADQLPTATGTGPGYILPIVFPVGLQRGTAISGKVIQFYKGHFMGVGQGEFRLNGALLNATMLLDRLARFALYDPTTGLYTQDDVGIDLPPPVGPATTTITCTPVVGPFADSPMIGGTYNVRVTAKNTKTLGFSNPSIALTAAATNQVVTLAAAGAKVRVTFNCDMAVDQNAWDIYVTTYFQSTSPTVGDPQVAFMGPWYFHRTVTDTELIDGGHPTGRTAGTFIDIAWADAEVQVASKLLTFDNFHPVDAEWLDMINGIPIYFSSLGKATIAKKEGTTLGPVAIPSKPSNPEAIFLNKAFTTAGGDYIRGVLNVRSRIFCPCENSLQVVILTTLDEEPIAFRSMWNVGFRNPYNLDAAKEYLYGFTTSGIVRSVAGGDDTSMEFEFSSDVKTYVESWGCPRVYVGRDPRNNAMIFFLSGAERRVQQPSGDSYWVTIALPFMLDRGVFNPPIVLQKTDSDFLVSGVATIGNDLVFLAGGTTAAAPVGLPVINTYIFDGGDNEDKPWHLAWAFADDGKDLLSKRIKGVSAVGRFDSATETKLKLYGVAIEGTFDLDAVAAGTGADNEIVVGDTGGLLGRKRLRKADFSPFPIYTIRMEGIHTGQTKSTVDRLDEIAVQIEVNSEQE
jgi:hypothetical protein